MVFRTRRRMLKCVISRSPRHILLVDDHAFVRRAMRRLLEVDPGLYVRAEASTFRQALRELRRDQTHLVIMDLVLPGEDGLQFIREVRREWPRLSILVVSLHKETLFAEPALLAGADGFLMKSDAPEHLVAAAHTVLAGRLYVSAMMQQLIFDRMRGADRGAGLAAASRVSAATRRGRITRPASSRRVHSSTR